MPTPIRITISGVVLEGELNDSKTANAIAKKLPIKFPGDYWGDEIYGTINVKCDEENPVDVIEEPGTLAYWPVGHAFCLFWGPTPVSRSGEIRPASPVNLIGRVTSGLEEFIANLPSPMDVRIEKA